MSKLWKYCLAFLVSCAVIGFVFADEVEDVEEAEEVVEESAESVETTYRIVSIGTVNGKVRQYILTYTPPDESAEELEEEELEDEGEEEEE